MQRWIPVFVLLAQASVSPGAEKITSQCTFAPGPINGALIEREGRGLAVYGWRRKR